MKLPSQSETLLVPEQPRRDFGMFFLGVMFALLAYVVNRAVAGEGGTGIREQGLETNPQSLLPNSQSGIREQGLGTGQQVAVFNSPFPNTSSPIPSPQSPKVRVGMDEIDRAYIERFRATALAEQKQYGIPAAISLAQGILESNAGRSTLARRNNNHFGMKCFGRRCRKGHCTNHTDDSHKDFFLVFPSPWASWRAHSKLLSSGRYKALHKYKSDTTKWAYGLKNLGYATAPDYAEQLIRIIRKYQL